MTTKKLIMGGTIATLLLATLISHRMVLSELDVIVTSGVIVDIFRIAAIGLLMGLLVVEPPRPMSFRVLAGLGAVGVFVGTLYGFLHFMLLPIDVLLGMMVAIVLAIEACEVTSSTATRSILSSGLAKRRQANL